MQPQLKMKHRIALMNIEDNLAFMPDSEDVKTLIKQHKKKRYYEKTNLKAEKTSKEIFGDGFWGEETNQLPDWFSEDSILQREIEE